MKYLILFLLPSLAIAQTLPKVVSGTYELRAANVLQNETYGSQSKADAAAKALWMKCGGCEVTITQPVLTYPAASSSSKASSSKASSKAASSAGSEKATLTFGRPTQRVNGDSFSVNDLDYYYMERKNGFLKIIDKRDVVIMLIDPPVEGEKLMLSTVPLSGPWSDPVQVEIKL